MVVLTDNVVNSAFDMAWVEVIINLEVGLMSLV